MKKQDKNKKNERILIFGNGQMGNFYSRFFKSRGILVKISTADILKQKQIEADLKKFKPTVVINTAAKTNLEWCANNKLEAFNVNVLGADNVANICDKLGVYLIHLSSGCIMSSKDEKDARKETDIPAPISYYSWTKVWAEQMLGFKKSDNFKCLILRPRQPVSAEINYKNMLLKMLTFTRFIDTPNSGTVIEDLMEWTYFMIQKRITGVYNVANEGWTTPYQIGLLLKKHILPDMPVIKITKEQLNKLTPEKRVDTIMDVSKLKKLIRGVKPYKTRLEEIIIELGDNFKKGKKSEIKEQLKKTVAQSKTRTIVNEAWPQLYK